MIDYLIQKVSFLNFIAPNIYGNFKTILHTVNFHVRGWEMSNTQRCRLPEISKFENIGDGYVIAAIRNAEPDQLEYRGR